MRLAIGELLRDHLRLPLEVIIVATVITSTTDNKGAPDKWTARVEQISVPLWEKLMKRNGPLPWNKERFFIGEEGMNITFVGYQMDGGESLSLSEIPFLKTTAQKGEVHSVHLHAALIVRPRILAKRPALSIQLDWPISASKRTIFQNEPTGWLSSCVTTLILHGVTNHNRAVSP